MKGCTPTTTATSSAPSPPTESTKDHPCSAAKARACSTAWARVTRASSDAPRSRSCPRSPAPPQPPTARARIRTAARRTRGRTAIVPTYP